MGIKHTFVSSKLDEADATKVRPANWNDDHTIDGDVDFGGFDIINCGNFNFPFVIVEDYGAVGDGDLNGNGTNDYAAIQAADNALGAQGGGILYFGPKIYVIASRIIKNDYVKWVGVPGVTTIIAKNGVDAELVTTTGYITSDGTQTKEINLEGIIFDGNAANAPRAAARSAVNVMPCDRVHVTDCIFRNATGYGFAGQIQNSSDVAEEIYLEHCEFNDNGVGILPVPPDTFDGLDFKNCRHMTLVDCKASGNSDMGIDVRGQHITFINCTALDNATNGFLAHANPIAPGLDTTLRIISGSASGNGEAGMRLIPGAGPGFCRVSVIAPHCYENTLYGISITNNESNTGMESEVIGGHVHDNLNHGIFLQNPLDSTKIVGTEIRANGRSGIRATAASGVHLLGVSSQENDEYGLDINTAVPGGVRQTACNFSGNGVGPILGVAEAMPPQWSVRRKTVDELRNTNTTLTADSTLSFPIAASAAYNFKAEVWYDTPAAADFKWDINGPAAPGFVITHYSYQRPGDTTDTFAATEQGFAFGPVVITELAGTVGYITFSGFVINGVNAGNVAFRWAQNVSNGSNTTVSLGSYIEFSEIV